MISNSRSRRLSEFQSTLSLRRATTALLPYRRGSHISIHALLAESDLSLASAAWVPVYFNPRSPCGERPSPRGYEDQNNSFQSTLSLRRATGSGLSCSGGTAISIHALLAESDRGGHDLPRGAQHFNPRSPCGERQDAINTMRAVFIFQSTLSLRRATAGAVRRKAGACISIHALLAESDSVSTFTARDLGISIHALLAESDHPVCPEGVQDVQFQSTLSLRRATLKYRWHISTQCNFNPRSPCGERPATEAEQAKTYIISIHALLAESDSLWSATISRWGNFNPRSPCGERPNRR